MKDIADLRNSFKKSLLDSSETAYVDPTSGQEIPEKEINAYVEKNFPDYLRALEGHAQTLRGGSGGGSQPGSGQGLPAQGQSARTPKIVRVAKNPQTGERVGLGEDGQWYRLPK